MHILEATAVNWRKRRLISKLYDLYSENFPKEALKKVLETSKE